MSVRVLSTGRVKVSPRGSGCRSGVLGKGRVKVSLRGFGVGLMLVWVQGFWIT